MYLRQPRMPRTTTSAPSGRAARTQKPCPGIFWRMQTVRRRKLWQRPSSRQTESTPPRSSSLRRSTGSVRSLCARQKWKTVPAGMLFRIGSGNSLSPTAPVSRTKNRIRENDKKEGPQTVFGMRSFLFVTRCFPAPASGLPGKHFAGQSPGHRGRGSGGRGFCGNRCSR